LHVSGGLAYLSACDTTVAAPTLTNEAVHIGSAFQLAGYQHVIGTLWPISDRLAGNVAEEFYRHLTRDGTCSPDIAVASHALHHTTRQLRSSRVSVPTAWAAHIHTGV
jgi:CHAT domain-containing protein